MSTDGGGVSPKVRRRGSIMATIRKVVRIPRKGMGHLIVQREASFLVKFASDVQEHAYCMLALRMHSDSQE